MTRLEIAVLLLTPPAVRDVKHAFDTATEMMLEEAERDPAYKDMASVRQEMDAQKILRAESEAEGSVPF